MTYELSKPLVLKTTCMILQNFEEMQWFVPFQRLSSDQSDAPFVKFLTERNNLK